MKSTLLRSAVLGLATGGRASAGPAAIAWTGESGRARLLTAAASAGELVGDKLPKTPSRLEPSGLAPRLVGAGACGALLARRAGTAPVGPALVAAVAALAGSFAGARWRGHVAARGSKDLPAALLEDATVAGLAAWSVS